MIARLFDPAVLAFIASRVEHQLGPNEAEDFLADERNVCLISQHGAALFQWTGPGIYGGHILMLPSGRGAHALEAGRAMIEAMFRSYGARLIWATPPKENRAARWYVRKLGFRAVDEGFWLERKYG